MSETPGPTRAEHHLGDSLAALVDGELGHDARERVLAHLATCHGCKAEADAQRQLKSVFADTAPPPPSAGLLARLQGLPVSVESEADDDPPPPGGAGAASPSFSLLAGGSNAASLLDPRGGFPVHRPVQSVRGSAGRGRRRFAFAAAGAFSLAAVALSGAFASSGPSGGPTASSSGTGTAPPRPTSAVERPAERRNEEAGQAVTPIRQGFRGLAASGEPSAAAAAPRPTPTVRSGGLPSRSPETPWVHAPGVPYVAMPPPSLRAPHLERPAPVPAPGAAPLAVSGR
ncbi:anti-sigma factor [Streptomyces sp. JJ38]|uniref:anti-sigma factor family protein n=1 Tax=Streptomyces sp. JJ38 TaxID=2738128 RepID=UPI001C58DEC7|nr:zf-HC2 domain-containing protein [Streptomyces sp. JJ38]MBW1598757.1 hypothetical protein [Streptomyces sp. JJ38]